MAHRGDDDGEHRVDGFESLDDAREYARRRTWASIEELRKPGMKPEDLRRLWALYGEDCSVLGDSYCGSTELERFIAKPATYRERDWLALDPSQPRRYWVRVYIDDNAGHSAQVGGYLMHPAKPTRDDLLRIYSDDAKEVFARQGHPDAVPATAMPISVFVLPSVPRPPSMENCPHWRIDIDFVCHDVKFGASAAGVFAWPEEPTRDALDAMTHLLIAETLSIRGDHPEYADYSDVVRRHVEKTTAPLTHSPDSA